MDGLNIYAIIAAALVAFFFGGFWYSKSIFGATWARASNLPYRTGKKHTRTRVMFALLFYVLAAFVFAILIGPQPELYYAIKSGAEIGIFFVATSIGINYLLAGRSVKLIVIDGTYHALQFMLYGLVLGLWR